MSTLALVRQLSDCSNSVRLIVFFPDSSFKWYPGIKVVAGVNHIAVPDWMSPNLDVVQALHWEGKVKSRTLFGLVGCFL